MSDASKYGRFFWTVHTRRSETIRLHADIAEVIDGAAVFSRTKEDGSKEINFAAGPGEWLHFYAASQIDGGAVAVEHWDEDDGAPVDPKGTEPLTSALRTKRSTS